MEEPKKFRCDTVQELLYQINLCGALQSTIEVYDVSGNKYTIVDCYNADDDDSIFCLDVRKD